MFTPHLHEFRKEVFIFTPRITPFPRRTGRVGLAQNVIGQRLKNAWPYVSQASDSVPRAFDAAAYSGLGWAGTRIAEAVRTRNGHRAVTAEQVGELIVASAFARRSI